MRCGNVWEKCFLMKGSRFSDLAMLLIQFYVYCIVCTTTTTTTTTILYNIIHTTGGEKAIIEPVAINN